MEIKLDLIAVKDESDLVVWVIENIFISVWLIGIALGICVAVEHDFFLEFESKLNGFLCQGIEIVGIKMDLISVMGWKLTWFLCPGSKLN